MPSGCSRGNAQGKGNNSEETGVGKNESTELVVIAVDVDCVEDEDDNEVRNIMNSTVFDVDDVQIMNSDHSSAEEKEK